MIEVFLYGAFINSGIDTNSVSPANILIKKVVTVLLNYVDLALKGITVIVSLIVF